MIEDIRYKDHAEWLAIRHRYIGGSEAGAVVGLNPYKSAYTLWAEKTDLVPEFEGNLTTKVGAYLEDLVAKLFEEETGKKVKRHNATMVNSKYPFACANVDRLVVGERSLLEIKTTSSLPTAKQIKGGEFPDSWYCQVMHYLAVTELDKAYIAVLVGNRDFRIFEVERDQAEIDSLMNAEEVFWTKVQMKTPPAVDGSADASETLTSLYPESDDSSVSLLAYERDLRTYMELGAEIKQLKAMQDEVANKVKAFMGSSGRGESDGFKVSWTSSERSSFDAKAFAKDNPKVDLSKYYNTTVSRTFRVTERKI